MLLFFIIFKILKLILFFFLYSQLESRNLENNNINAFILVQSRWNRNTIEHETEIDSGIYINPYSTHLTWIMVLDSFVISIPSSYVTILFCTAFNVPSQPYPSIANRTI